MPFNSQIDRTEASALMPEEVAELVNAGVIDKSICLSKMRKLPNMSRKQERVPVINLLPQSYFVNGDTGLRQTTDLSWQNKYIEAEELCTIIPVPRNVIDDSGYPIWDQAMPYVMQGKAQVIDTAICIGTGKPTLWPTSIKDKAVAAGNSVSVAASTNLHQAILGDGGLYSKIELDGYMVDGVLANVAVKGKLRGMVDLNGQPLLQPVIGAPTQYTLDGAEVTFAQNNPFALSDAWMIAGKWSELVYSIRQDIAFEVHTSGVIQDNTGAIVFNLLQQRMAAIVIWMRLGWQYPNPPNLMQPTEANRSAFGVLLA